MPSTGYIDQITQSLFKSCVLVYNILIATYTVKIKDASQFKWAYLEDIQRCNVVEQWPLMQYKSR
jgi:hypothetical protein